MNFEEMLNEDKNRLDQIQAPENMEERLRNALETRSGNVTETITDTSKKSNKPKHFTKHFKAYAASILVLLALTVFNFDAIAYYGKQLLGYEQVMNGTLKQLSELGKGQPIGKSFTFSDGVNVTIDYVMLDENQLLLFYTVNDPAGQVGECNPLLGIKGLWGDYHHQSGQGEMNEEQTEIKWISSFQAPRLLEKNLTLNLRRYDQRVNEAGKIEFTLDRSQAMGHTLKKKLNMAFEVDNATLTLDSILASPTQTVIKGSIQNIWQLAKDQLSGERIMPSNLRFRLYAESPTAGSQEIDYQGGGMSTDLKGITFEHKFDALPTDLTALKLELVSFGAEHQIDRQIDLSPGEQEITLKGQTIRIDGVKVSGNETLVTITSVEDLVLSRVYLLADGERISLEETITDNFDKTDEGRIIHTRTLRFLGSGEHLELDIQRMMYSTEYNKVIEIPVD